MSKLFSSDFLARYVKDRLVCWSASVDWRFHQSS